MSAINAKQLAGRLHKPNSKARQRGVSAVLLPLPSAIYCYPTTVTSFELAFLGFKYSILIIKESIVDKMR